MGCTTALLRVANSRISRPFLIALFLLALLSLGGAGCLFTTQDPGTPLVLGLDHIPVAVVDLDAAAGRYRDLGFVLKPGRMHENGIQNQHVKFPDGTEIELITASEVRDPLSTEYLQHLTAGDGAAFIGFYAPDIDQLAGQLDADGRHYRREGGMLTFPQTDVLHYIFFGSRVRSPSDQPAHFEHGNGAEALIGVWIAGDDLAAERQLLTTLGATFSEQKVHTPERSRVPVASFGGAQVIFLPVSRQLVPDRKIVGVTVRTNDLDATRRELVKSSLAVPPVVETADGRSIFVPPDIANGIWLEFRQDGGSG